jgi:hypothetical protein
VHDNDLQPSHWRYGIGLQQILWKLLLLKPNRKTMKKINDESMIRLKGGVDQATYCNTLCMIITCNPPTMPMLNAWATYCSGYAISWAINDYVGKCRHC